MRPHPPAARRIALLDWVKAAAIVNMVAYHALYDAAFLFGAAGVQAFMRSAPAHWWERCICGSFILVSGALALHSRRPYRRALAVFGAGLLITAVTLAFTPQLSIWFGILHFLGLAGLLTALAAPALRRVPPWAGLAACAALFWLTHTIPYAQWPWGAPLPQALYDAKFRLGLGFWPMNSGLTSSDYFPLMPWLFLFWAGLFAGRAVHGTPLAAACARVPRCRAAEWLARHALVIYVVHQPLAAGLVWLILRFA